MEIRALQLIPIKLNIGKLSSFKLKRIMISDGLSKIAAVCTLKILDPIVHYKFTKFRLKLSKISL